MYAYARTSLLCMASDLLSPHPNGGLFFVEHFTVFPNLSFNEHKCSKKILNIKRLSFKVELFSKFENFYSILKWRIICVM